DFDESTARYLGHFGDADEIVSEEDRVTTEAFLRMGGVAVEVVQHAGTEHGFAERGRVGHDAEAADVAWASTVDLLRRRLVPETA
ncbi:MAG: dienelactone hydrolase family protein, partial [Actinomycetota bacterium]